MRKKNVQASCVSQYGICWSTGRMHLPEGFCDGLSVCCVLHAACCVWPSREWATFGVGRPQVRAPKHKQARCRPESFAEAGCGHRLAELVSS